MDKLLPCPFCGGSALRLVHAMGEAWVRCETCRANNGVSTGSTERAIVAWNTRAKPTPEPAVRMTNPESATMPPAPRLCSECAEPTKCAATGRCQRWVRGEPTTHKEPQA